MMCGLIDLNTVNDDTDEVSTSSESSGSAPADLLPAVGSTPVVCCLELWHACAGPLISLPKKGNAVVYCPQGHLEQLQSAGNFHISGDFGLPPHVFCRVLDVKLHAEAGTDDVYAQVSLVQDPQLEQKWREGGRGVEYAEDDNGVYEKSTTPHMFCKTLTASDTSTHGGFSVPRRAAEDCFPPLDYKQQRPSQEIIAKDLHGIEWKFRHIYRGQPRRHLLTTGWSAYVNKKKLVCGDAVLFLRGDDGVLRLGIRRATQVRVASTSSSLCSQQLMYFDFSTVVNSISQRSSFNVYYNPKGGSSEFIVPYTRFMHSLANSFSPGTRFKLRVETEDAGDRRSMGVIKGVNDIDPARWPGSKWRCLMVRWDDGEITRPNRVSPWEIERCGLVSDTGTFGSPLLKRTRTGLPVSKDWSTGASNLGESMRFHKVLQGQEIYGFYRCNEISPLGDDIRNQTSVGFGELSRFNNRVLQGQEMSPNLQYGERIPNCGRFWTPTSSTSSSPSSVLRFQQAISQNPNTYRLCYTDNMNPLSGQNRQDIVSPLKIHQEEPKNSCRLFGFSLTEGSNGMKVSRGSSDKDRVHPLGPVLNTKVGGSCINETVHHLYRASDGFVQGL
ncbi:auxin response factor 3-like [Rutidosis leptorrhynchoides]|uniref:auxin response factor 3-like n=1 Tax=Rutidosis leptorrhynchoides TaxID=125765 RepID=UPI003A99F210